MTNIGDSISRTRFSDIFKQGIPLIDLRSPAEFEKGAFPNTVNLPLMTNDERVQVGICYKQKGQDAAIALGHQLVCGKVKQQRLQSWCEFILENPKGALFCWRGGLRSEIVQRWIFNEGLHYPRVTGGYKALRRYLIDITPPKLATFHLYLLAGNTGCGKTALLNQLPQTLDLEGLANHNGSGFGARVWPQPTTINFENQLSIDLLKMSAGPLLVEDEGSYIGSITLPLVLRQLMLTAPLVLLDLPLEERVNNIHRDYIVQRLQEFSHRYGDVGVEQFENWLKSSLAKIARRLGGSAYGSLKQLLATALAQQRSQNNDEYHKVWIKKLLQIYYDPMYDYQLTKKYNPLVYKGTASEVKQWWLQSLAENASSAVRSVV